MRNQLKVIVCALMICGTALGAEGKGIHALGGLGLTRATGNADTDRAPGGLGFAGLLIPLHSKIDFSAKVEYQNTPGANSRSSALLVGPGLLFAPRKRGSHIAPVLLVGAGWARANEEGLTAKNKTYGELGFGLKIAAREAASILFLARLTNFQFNGPSYTFASFSVGFKF